MVNVRYCRALTICLYLMESEYKALDIMTNLDEEDEGVSIDLQEDIPARQRISKA